MNNYLLTLIITSISISIANIIAPTNSEISKYIKLIGSLIILCVIINSFGDAIKISNGNFINEIKDSLIIDTDNEKEKYNQILHDYLNSYSKEGIENEMKEILEKEFQIPKNEASIELYTNFINDKLTLTEIKILLSGKSIFKNPYRIEERFKEIWQCECSVLIK